jgi:hypothetical protein
MQVSLTRKKPHVLEHLPTPMARTVFGTELHFRLLGHRLAYVPWDEVLERMKADAPRHVNKLKDTPRMEFSLPVIAGFGSRYVLRRADVEIETRIGTARQSGVELEQVYMVDVEQNLGQPMTEVFSPTSELFSRLSGMKPQNTTVTIWVYPDSFDDFRALKADLFKRGFLTAARPMPMGEPIAGRPQAAAPPRSRSCCCRLQCALAARIRRARSMSAAFDPYKQWLDIGGGTAGGHYRLLRLARFESNLAKIAAAADDRMARIRSYQTGPRETFTQSC